MRTIIVRECPCDGAECGPACGSAMVDRVYVAALVTDDMLDRSAAAYDFGVYPGDESQASESEIRDMARRVLDAALTPAPSQEGRFEYRVVNATIGDLGPSLPYDLLSEAEAAAARRYDRFPEDGPQKIQQRYIAAWEDR